MNWKSDIKSYIDLTLGYNWFLNVRERFTNNEYYNKDKHVLDDPNEYSFYSDVDLNGNACGELVTVKTEVEFYSYCWSGNSSGMGEKDDLYKSEASMVPRFVIGQTLSTIIQNNLPPGEIIAAYRFIQGFIDYLYNVILELQTENDNDEYVALLDRFYIMISEMIQDKNRGIFEYKELAEYHDKLQFSLNQDQLSALLYLIQEAGFINETNKPGISDYFEFCERYFYCIKRGYSSQILNVKKGISAARTGENYEALDMIFKKLDNAHDKAMAKTANKRPKR